MPNNSSNFQLLQSARQLADQLILISMASFRFVPSEGLGGDVSPAKHTSGPLIAAFQTLDTNRQGFFPKDILLHILTTKGSLKLEPVFVEQVLDEVSLGGRVYYKDICELFKKTSLMAEDIREERRKRGQTTNTKRGIEPTRPECVEEEYDPVDPLGDSKLTTNSQDTTESFPSSPIATPTQGPDSASVDIPITQLENDESLGEPTAKPAASEMEDYVTLNYATNEAAIFSAEGSLGNIPELLKRAQTSQN